MFRKIILKLLLRWYVSKLDEIKKLPVDIELKYYAFSKEEHIAEVLKASMTAQTLWHFEARSDEERWMAKGAALFIKNLLAAHAEVQKIISNIPDEDKQVIAWKKFKQGNRIN